MLTVSVHAVLPDVGLALRIAVEHLVYIVSLALACALAVVERSQVVAHVAKQRVAHHEELVGLAAGVCRQRTAV